MFRDDTSMSDFSGGSYGYPSARQLIPLDMHRHGADLGSARRGEAIARLTNSVFLLGDINLHEDLHFSTYYLRASLSAVTRSDYPGYSLILADYNTGNERYFILEEEAERTAQWLINRCVANPRWLSGKLTAIEHHARRLSKAFSDTTSVETFRALNTEDLVAVYLRHDALHKALYRYARIPEALDRGRPFFSDYLRQYLAKIGTPSADLPNVFEALTTARVPSVVAEAERAFDEIVAAVRVGCPEILKSNSPHMFLPSSIRQALGRHRAQWGWLSYHGYRNPTLPTEADYLRRLLDVLIRPAIKREVDHNDTTVGRIDVDSIYRNMDSRHKELFRLVGEIGRVKLFRRYCQLRNFHFLDMMLAECARRLDVSEWTLRCCFPEELVAALRGGGLKQSIKDRSRRCGVIYSNEDEYVLADGEVDALLTSIKINREQSRDPAVRYGTSACVGFARGTARIVDDGMTCASAFRNGDILICSAADPDLLPLIRRSSAVVTQQGGVTSHASVVCREIGVPTVIGVDDLLSFIHNGDEVEIDATRGHVRRVAHSREETFSSLVVPVEFWDRPEFVGVKAANLQSAKKLGFKVPPYTLLWFDEAVSMLRQNESHLRATLLQLSARLNLGADTMPSFLLRSSAVDEDREYASQAGRYVSVSLSVLDPIRAVHEFVERNQTLGYRGAVILQLFLPASFSGVSLDSDTLAKNKLVVEFVQGSVNTVTTGRGHNERFTYDRLSTEVVGSKIETFCHLPVADLVEWLLSIGAAFGRPNHTEWGYFDRNYWLYQVRAAGRRPLNCPR